MQQIYKRLFLMKRCIAESYCCSTFRHLALSKSFFPSCAGCINHSNKMICQYKECNMHIAYPFKNSNSSSVLAISFIIWQSCSWRTPPPLFTSLEVQGRRSCPFPAKSSFRSCDSSMPRAIYGYVWHSACHAPHIPMLSFTFYTCVFDSLEQPLYLFHSLLASYAPPWWILSPIGTCQFFFRVLAFQSSEVDGRCSKSTKENATNVVNHIRHSERIEPCCIYFNSYLFQIHQNFKKEIMF